MSYRLVGHLASTCPCPYGFIWIPFCLDLKPRRTCPVAYETVRHIASSQSWRSSHCIHQGRQGQAGSWRSNRLHLNTFLSRSGSIHFGSPPKLVRWPFATFLFVPNGCSKHQTCTFRSKQSRAEQQRRHGRQGGQTERFCLMSSRNAHFEASRAERRRRRQGRQSRQGRQTEQTGVQQRPRWDATGQVKRTKALGARTTIFVVLGGSQRSNHCKRSAWELLALKPLYS